MKAVQHPGVLIVFSHESSTCPSTKTLQRWHVAATEAEAWGGIIFLTSRRARFLEEHGLLRVDPGKQ